MQTNIFATAVALSDKDLLARLDILAIRERESAAELLGHLAALELRPSLYLAQGYGSLFEYCRRALHLSEDAACNRIKAVRACQEFPVILDLLFAGILSLTAVRLLGPHLTFENHEIVLGRAAHQARGGIEALVAELAPRPDVRASVRKLPAPKAEASTSSADEPTGRPRLSDATLPLTPPPPPVISDDGTLPDAQAVAALGSPSGPPWPLRAAPRPIVQALAPERYRVQFTIGQKTHDRLRRVQTLLRREIPNGDPAAIFDRASREGREVEARLDGKTGPDVKATLDGKAGCHGKAGRHRKGAAPRPEWPWRRLRNAYPFRNG